jgi:hypothetical protein
MAANMDTTGTMEMAKALASHKLFTAIHKHYTTAQWKTFMQNGGEGINRSYSCQQRDKHRRWQKTGSYIKRK